MILVTLRPINLNEFPSPVELRRILLDKDSLATYKARIVSGNKTLIRLFSMSRVSRLKEISTWCKQIRTRHLELQAKGLMNDYDLNLLRYDLGKLDIVFINDFGRSFFHSSNWLYELYNVKLSANGSIASLSVPSSLPVFTKQRSGAPIEPTLASFSTPFSEVSTSFWKWVESDFSGPVPREMTVKRLWSITSGKK